MVIQSISITFTCKTKTYCDFRLCASFVFVSTCVHFFQKKDEEEICKNLKSLTQAHFHIKRKYYYYDYFEYVAERQKLMCGTKYFCLQLKINADLHTDIEFFFLFNFDIWSLSTYRRLHLHLCVFIASCACVCMCIIPSHFKMLIDENFLLARTCTPYCRRMDF